MWGNHLLSRFFWLAKCPKSSTKQILNANGEILTLRAWQRSNSIVYQHKDRSFKSNQVKLLEMIWHDMKCKDSSPKWYEMIWKDVKGYEKILTEPNICKGLFTRMIGVPFLMWQRQTHATVSGHFSSVYDLAWPKKSKDHSDMLYKFHIFCRTCWRDSILLWFMNKDHSILKVKLVTGLDEWTCST